MRYILLAIALSFTPEGRSLCQNLVMAQQYPPAEGVNFVEARVISVLDGTATAQVQRVLCGSSLLSGERLSASIVPPASSTITITGAHELCPAPLRGELLIGSILKMVSGGYVLNQSLYGPDYSVLRGEELNKKDVAEKIAAIGSACGLSGESRMLFLRQCAVSKNEALSFWAVGALAVTAAKQNTVLFLRLISQQGQCLSTWMFLDEILCSIKDAGWEDSPKRKEGWLKIAQGKLPQGKGHAILERLLFAYNRDPQTKLAILEHLLANGSFESRYRVSAITQLAQLKTKLGQDEVLVDNLLSIIKGDPSKDVKLAAAKSLQAFRLQEAQRRKLVDLAYDCRNDSDLYPVLKILVLKSEKKAGSP